MDLKIRLFLSLQFPWYSMSIIQIDIFFVHVVFKWSDEIEVMQYSNSLAKIHYGAVNHRGSLLYIVLSNLQDIFPIVTAERNRLQMQDALAVVLDF